MNIDIRLSISYFAHPKIIKLEKELGIKAIKAQDDFAVIERQVEIMP